MSTAPLLHVRGLRIGFPGDVGVIPIVDGVDLSLEAGKTLGIVGESGCGKSLTAAALMGLVPAPGQVTGSVLLDGTEVVGAGQRTLRKLRGGTVAMVFQDPLAALNPVHTVGAQVAEAVMLHRPMTATQARGDVLSLFKRVGLPDPESRMDAYPHQMSGGQRQRVVIAMALASQPRLLLCDEPTTALDVTVQAQILDLLRDLQAETGMAMVMISHDLGVVADVADNVAVMYLGRVVEHADAETLFRDPRHPYTRGLLETLPKVDAPRGRLPAIPGAVPGAGQRPRGCAFAPRCSRADALCQATDPQLGSLGPTQAVACLKAMEAA